MVSVVEKKCRKLYRGLQVQLGSQGLDREGMGNPRATQIQADGSGERRQCQEGSKKSLSKRPRLDQQRATRKMAKKCKKKTKSFLAELQWLSTPQFLAAQLQAAV